MRGFRLGLRRLLICGALDQNPHRLADVGKAELECNAVECFALECG